MKGDGKKVQQALIFGIFNASTTSVMKLNALFLFFVAFSIEIKAQNLYCKSETEIKGLPSFIAKNAKGTTYAYYTPSKWKTETSTMNSTQVNYVDENGAIVLNDIGTDKNCGRFTKEEMLIDSLDTDMIITEVLITKTDETKRVLGYLCKKVIITYKIAQTIPLECEMILWCTDEIKYPNISHLPEINKRNSLSVAIGSLNSFPLITETLMKSNRLRTINTVVEINTKEINPGVFLMDMKHCKKPLNMREYKAMLIKRQHQAQMMGR